MLQKNINNSGVTLIEIIIAFLILCSCTLGIAGMISFGHKGTSVDFRQGEAIQLLTDRLNKLSALSFKELSKVVPASGKVIVDDNAWFIPFGNEEKPIVIGKNKYSVTAELSYQPITFSGLMQLHFPNPQYDPNKPHTWRLEKKIPNDVESFVGTRNAFIKIVVNVRPVENMYFAVTGKKNDHKERQISAVTFVANLDGYI